jgi:predicted dehydrogenase
MYRVGVIGLGKIGMKYDSPQTKNPYNHLGGIRDCKAVSLTAVADLLPEKREEFAGRWEGEFPSGSVTMYEEGRDLIKQHECDVIAICVKGPDHFALTKYALEHGNAKVIYLEKPMGCSLQQTEDMDRMAQEKGVTILVDFSRHFDPHVLHMQKLIKDGLIGEVKTVVGLGGGTVLSDCSHVIDSICQFAGYNPQSVHAWTYTDDKEIPTGYLVEPRFHGASIRFANGITGHLVLAQATGREFSIEIVGTKGTAYTGMYIESRVTDKHGKPVDDIKLDLPEKLGVFEVAYSQIAGFLDGGPLPECTRDAYRAVNEIAFASIESGQTGAAVNLPCNHRDRLIFANG